MAAAIAAIEGILQMLTVAPHPLLDVRAFTLKTLPARMKKLKDDPMASVLTLKPDLQSALAKLTEKLK